MGYTTESGQYVSTKDLNLDPTEGTLTEDGTSATVEVGGHRSVSLTLDVTAVSDSDSLDVTIETTDDDTNWYSVGTFTQATAATTERKTFTVGRKVRASYDVTGSDVSIDCTLRGEAVK